MATDTTPEEFRARSTALYRRVGRRLVAAIFVAGGVGTVAGALIGRAIGHAQPYEQAPPGGFWLAGALIGLATAAVLAALVAGVIWVAVSLLYVMTQDGA